MFLLFPIILNFMSPYLIIDGAFDGVLSGSAILFILLFVSSLVVGRAWCGWLCPGAGLQEAAFYIRDKKVSQKPNWVKWLIWVPWMAVIVMGFVAASGIHGLDPLRKTETGVSLTEPMNYIIYYTVVVLIFGLSLTVGNRAMCHYGCWMAPFMMTGRKLRNLGKWPSLRLVAESEKCSYCKTCVRNCPMSLDVNGMVHLNTMENSECILCGNCVDGCTKDIFHYEFNRG